ncbi:30S ribosome-binding factor RbfA [soil metagenome]
MAEVKRAVRVAARVQEELALLLSRRVKDPRVQGVVMSRVTLTDDLRLVRVLFRLLEDSEELRAEAIIGLKTSTPLRRRELTRAAGLRVAPEISFFHDDGLDKVLQVERLLHEIETEKKAKSKAKR